VDLIPDGDRVVKSQRRTGMNSRSDAIDHAAAGFDPYEVIPETLDLVSNTRLCTVGYGNDADNSRDTDAASQYYERTSRSIPNYLG